MVSIVQPILHVSYLLIDSLVNTLCGILFWIWFFIILFEIIGRVKEFFNNLNNPPPQPIQQSIPKVKVEPCECCCRYMQQKINASTSTSTSTPTSPTETKQEKDTDDDGVEIVSPPSKEPPSVDIVMVE